MTDKDRIDMQDESVENVQDTDLEEGVDREETSLEEEGEKESKTSKNPEESEYEDVCFICRRPESKAGRMFKMPNNICVCDDCMHKTMDSISQFDYHGMLGPNMGNMPNMPGMPNISFLNISDLQGDGGIPNKQKLKN